MSRMSPVSAIAVDDESPHFNHRVAPSVSALVAPRHLPIRDANGEEMSRQITEHPYPGDRNR